MRILVVLMLAFFIDCLAVPKPMESITNYNVMMVHGAYGPKNSDGKLQGFDPGDYSQAIDATEHLGAASMGSYTSNKRVTKWISHNILEEPEWGNDSSYVRNSYVYNWRAFSNTRNSSKNNAVELGNRTWNKKNEKFGNRRALVEEAQEVKAKFVVDENDPAKDLYGQEALDSIRKYPDLFRQLASRYILVGHSMGGVVSREYVQNSNFYHGDVDKIITLDSPHEGTGALNMQLDMVNVGRSALEGVTTSVVMMASFATAYWIAGVDISSLTIGAMGLSFSLEFAALNLFSGELLSIPLEDYIPEDSIVCYVDPNARNNRECDDVETINDLNKIVNSTDSMPMFRILAGEHSMTFTDPKLGARSALSLFVPDLITVPFVNLYAQFLGGGDFTTNYVNSMTGLAVGIMGGVNVQDHGSALVETKSGLAAHVEMLNGSGVDVKRDTFPANYYASISGLSTAVDVALGVGVAAAIAVEVIPGVGKAAKLGIGAALALGLSPSIELAIVAGAKDLSKSHNYPIEEKFKDWMLNDSVHVYEDFLYEKPFVNLALNDARTMDSLAKNTTAKLNRNCYYEENKNIVHLCEIGLYGQQDSLFTRDSIVVSGSDTIPFYNAVNDGGDSVFVDTARWYGTFKRSMYSEFAKRSP